MKVLVKKSILESIVANVNPYLEKKDLSSINSHIFISAIGDTLNIKATDHEIGLAYKISNNITINEEGQATANGTKLLQIIKGLKDGDITLETDDKYIFIRQNNSKYKLPMQNPSDFPAFPNTNDKSKFEINAGIISRSLKKISPCIDVQSPKIEITGALLDIQDQKINLVATDNKRLSIYKLNLALGKEFKLIIPKKAITEIQKLFFEDIEIYYDENIFIAISPNFEFFTKLINGNYPNYEKIIKDDFKNNINLDRDKMVDGIKTISMLSENIKITFNSDNILFESHNEDNSEAKTRINYDLNLSDSFSFVVKTKFILDFLSSIENTEFKLGFNDPTLPFVLESGELKTIIVPMNE